jgi:hypothetical protein
LKIPESPEDYFRGLATLRKAARDEIERLIDFLDRAAGDPDLEPAGDEHEPTLDCEKDDADDEDSDPGEESDEGEDGGDTEPNGDEMDGNLAGSTSEVEGQVYPPPLEYAVRLRKRRGQPSGHRTEHGFHSVGPLIPVVQTSLDESITVIHPDGRREEFDRFGYPVLR